MTGSHAIIVGNAAGGIRMCRGLAGFSVCVSQMQQRERRRVQRGLSGEPSQFWVNFARKSLLRKFSPSQAVEVSLAIQM
jgi:hypothetical protein